MRCEVEDETGEIAFRNHDGNGNVVSLLNAKQVGWSDSEYDARNQLVSRTDTYGDTTKTFYDKNGNVVANLDAKHANITIDPFTENAGYISCTYDARNMKDAMS